MAMNAGETQAQLRSRYNNIPVYNSQADLDYATSRTAPWSHQWGDERGLARIGDSIYEFDNQAGWNRIRTVPQGTFPTTSTTAATDDTSIGSILSTLLGDQVTGGITATG